MKDFIAAIKIEFREDRKIGPGKILLLEGIAETGSISSAARKMTMSYRKAWLLIEEMNIIFGKAVVETAAGGKGGGGAIVTPLGFELIKRYRHLQTEVQHHAEDALRGLI